MDIIKIMVLELEMHPNQYLYQYQYQHQSISNISVSKNIWPTDISISVILVQISANLSNIGDSGDHVSAVFLEYGFFSHLNWLGESGCLDKQEVKVLLTDQRKDMLKQKFGLFHICIGLYQSSLYSSWISRVKISVSESMIFIAVISVIGISVYLLIGASPVELELIAMVRSGSDSLICNR